MIINRNKLLQNPPFDPKYMVSKTKLNGVSYGLSEAGYDIRLAEDVHFKKGFLWQRNTEVTEYRNTFHDDIKKTTIHKGRFALASAMERFQMPENLVGIVHDKSTWARSGLSVFNTVIEPGWEGFLTLELVFHGHGELFIPAGSGIAQVLFHEVAVPTKYAGKYQNQSTGVTPPIFK